MHLELSVGGGLSDVRAEAGPGKVERVDDAERGGAGGAARRQVAGEELPEVLVLVQPVHEHLLVGVLEGEVERLRGEVPAERINKCIRVLGLC